MGFFLGWPLSNFSLLLPVSTILTNHGFNNWPFFPQGLSVSPFEFKVALLHSLIKRDQEICLPCEHDKLNRYGRYQVLQFI